MLGTGLLGIFLTAQAADPPQSQLLPEASARALQLKNDAIMISYGAAHSNVNWTGRAKQVQQHIRDARLSSAKLREQRASLPPEQIATIDRIQPLLNELIGNTEAVLRYLEENPSQLGQHKGEIAVRVELASSLASLIANYVSYGNARQKLQAQPGESAPQRR